jgi:site-specific recombinase XerD
MSNNTTALVLPILTARKVSPLRQRMIDDMTVRNFAPNTVLCYLKQVSYFAQHFGTSPDRLGPEEIRSYQIYLAKERKVGISSRTAAVCALRFLYHVTLKRDRAIEMIPFPKQECQLPVIVSPEEVLRLLGSRSLLFLPGDLQHDVRHWVARERGPSSAGS